MPPVSDTRGHHLLFFAPIAGMVVTWAALIRRPDDDEEGRADLRAAVKWQALGAGVLLLHLVLQLAIVAVDALWRSGPGLGEPLQSLFPLAITGLTWLNLGGGAVEWLFLGAWAVAASRGRPYPVGRRRTSRAHDGTPTG